MAMAAAMDALRWAAPRRRRQAAVQGWQRGWFVPGWRGRAFACGPAFLYPNLSRRCRAEAKSPDAEESCQPRAELDGSGIGVGSWPCWIFVTVKSPATSR